LIIVKIHVIRNIIVEHIGLDDAWLRNLHGLQHFFLVILQLLRSGEEFSSALFAGAVVNVVLEIGVRSWIFGFLLEERKEVTQTFGVFFSFLD
jgi:hypothetical protein